MSDDLYQQAILDRVKTPVKAGRLPSPDASVTLDNPLCGDRVTLDVMLNGKTITDLAHQVRGCALCQASASVLAEALVGREITAARAGRDALQSMLAGGEPAAPWQALGIFAPVRRHKSRHDCVRLPFDALDLALAEAAKQ